MTVRQDYFSTRGGAAEASVRSDGRIAWEPATFTMVDGSVASVSGGDSRAECRSLQDLFGLARPFVEAPIDGPPVLIVEWDLSAPLPEQAVSELDPSHVPQPVRELGAEVRFLLVQPVADDDTGWEGEYYVELVNERRKRGRVLQSFSVEATLDCTHGFQVGPWWVSRNDPPAELAPICRPGFSDTTECVSYTLEREGDDECLFELAPAAYPTTDGRWVEAALGGELRRRTQTLEVFYTAIELR